jgi:hypothetical protein
MPGYSTVYRKGFKVLLRPDMAFKDNIKSRDIKRIGAGGYII